MKAISRRSFIYGCAGAAAVSVARPAAQAFAEPMPDAMTTLLTRRSVRAYTESPVSQEHIEALLRAAMAAPSARNKQPWEFVVITDKAQLQAIPAINTFASMAKNAPLAILTCVNTKLDDNLGYGVQSVSAATQNMLLAAHTLGLGAVWTGVYPQEDRMDSVRNMFALPEHILPLALVVIGHPASKPEKADRFLPARIHQNRW